MSAKTVTDTEGAAREAALRAMQEAAESAAGGIIKEWGTERT